MYGSHFSSSGSTLNYMVRLEPFSTLCKELQNGKFDVADRLFRNLEESWRSVTNNSDDVKELIPEFFYFPDFLRNMFFL